MDSVPSIPFHKKLTEQPLLWGSYTALQLVISVGLMVAVMGFCAIFWGFLGGIVGCGVTFGSTKFVCGYVNTRCPPGFIIHKILAAFARTQMAPGFTEWHPVSAPIPEENTESANYRQ